MNERDIIIDPIITHNNYLIEVAPDEFVNVTQLWKEYKQIVKDKKDLQNRIDKAIEYLYEHSQYNDADGVHYIKEDEYCVDYLLDILKESGD